MDQNIKILTFHEIYNKFHETEYIDKMMYSCFGANCYILCDGGDICVFFDLLTHTVYMIEKYSIEDGSPIYIWIDTKYKDLYITEYNKCVDNNIELIFVDDMNDIFKDY